MQQDLGIYSAYKNLKRSQGLIDKAIEQDEAVAQEPIAEEVSAMEADKFQKYNELIKKLQVKSK
jgi:hypothetical protein